MNTWPGNKRHAMYPEEHEKWNSNHFPGTRQVCTECETPTGRCEEDSLFADEDNEIGPLCKECFEQLQQDA